MQDTLNGFDIPMLGLNQDDWLQKLETLVDEHGYLHSLGKHHHAAFVEDGKTLLVTFETLQSIQNRGDTGHPLGFELVHELGWSHMCILSDGDTWFRDEHVYRHFDRLVDDGFFEDFDQVLFYGTGPCGYAAAAFSVTAPGATVVVLQPQATLDPRIAGWDTRYPHMRRTSFTDRYGYAPDMIDAANQAFVLFDPREQMDAMHAALFARPNVTALPLPMMGTNLEKDLLDMHMLFRIFAKAGAGKLDVHSFANLYRARRSYIPYLKRVLALLDAKGRPYIKALLCASVYQRTKAPFFLRHLKRLEQAAMSGAL